MAIYESSKLCFIMEIYVNLKRDLEIYKELPKVYGEWSIIEIANYEGYGVVGSGGGQEEPGMIMQ